MGRAPGICIEHGCPNIVVANNRCREHNAERSRRQARTTPTKRALTHAERRRRATVVANWRATHGDWCPGYRRPPHEAHDLTAEHDTPVADGGTHLTVLCRSCNSRHGAETMRRLRST